MLIKIIPSLLKLFHAQSFIQVQWSLVRRLSKCKIHNQERHHPDLNLPIPLQWHLVRDWIILNSKQVIFVAYLKINQRLVLLPKLKNSENKSICEWRKVESLYKLLPPPHFTQLYSKPTYNLLLIDSFMVINSVSTTIVQYY